MHRQEEQGRGEASLSSSDLEGQKRAEKYGVLSGAFFFSAGTLISRFLGLLRDMVMAALLSKVNLDSFLVAFRLPSFLRALAGESPLSAAFLPHYVQALDSEQQPTEKSKKLFFAGGFWLLFFLAFTVIIGILQAEFFISLLVDESFKAQSQRFEQVVQSFQVLLLFAACTIFSSYLMVTLQAHKQFFKIGLAPAIFNFCFIFVIVAAAFQGQSLTVLVWGVVLSGVIQVLFLWSSLAKLGLSFGSFFKTFRAKGLAVPIGLNLLPSVVAVGGSQIIGLINVAFATKAQPGSVAQIFWAERLYQLPVALLAISLGTSLLPRLSHLGAGNLKNKEELSAFKKEANQSLKLAMALAFPAVLGIVSLAYPIMYVFFFRGDVELSDISQAAQLLQIYAPLIVVSCLVRVVATVFFSFKHTWYVACAALLGCALHAFLVSILFDRWGLSALAISAVIAGCFNLLILEIFLYLKFKIKIDTLKAVCSGFVLLPSFFAMGIGLWGIEKGLHQFLAPSFLLHFLWVILGLLWGVGIYFFVNIRVIKNPWVMQVYQVLISRMRGRS